MPASTILSSIRQPLATALAGVAGNVYAWVPETIIPPAVVLVPSSPYLEPTLLNKSTLKLQINMTVTCAVAYTSNPASLDNLEQLILSVLAVIPSGYEIGQIDRPTVTQVGSSNLLVADISVSTIYTQTT
jgi:hypothetical protein